ncbi:MAG TPA: sulfatase-like hydrolase/transferase, partial [Clostridiales bacterium]|nr:sulfatase-like hydrolase/transferase [Clostridiales bacterium]
MKKTFSILSAGMAAMTGFAQESTLPNIVLIYADDLGFGDLSCYGATRVHTPHVDALAQEGIRFVNAHSAAATSTPSRYGLFTGEYPWRRKGTGIAAGDAALIIKPDRYTVPKMLKEAGYR